MLDERHRCSGLACLERRACSPLGLCTPCCVSCGPRSLPQGEGCPRACPFPISLLLYLIASTNSSTAEKWADGRFEAKTPLRRWQPLTALSARPKCPRTLASAAGKPLKLPSTLHHCNTICARRGPSRRPSPTFPPPDPSPEETPSVWKPPRRACVGRAFRLQTPSQFPRTTDPPAPRTLTILFFLPLPGRRADPLRLAQAASSSQDTPRPPAETSFDPFPWFRGHHLLSPDGYVSSRCQERIAAFLRTDSPLVTDLVAATCKRHSRRLPPAACL